MSERYALNIRISKVDHEWIIKKAGEMGLSLAAYVRLQIINMRESEGSK